MGAAMRCVSLRSNYYLSRSLRYGGRVDSVQHDAWWTAANGVGCNQLPGRMSESIDGQDNGEVGQERRWMRMNAQQSIRDSGQQLAKQAARQSVPVLSASCASEW